MSLCNACFRHCWPQCLQGECELLKAQEHPFIMSLGVAILLLNLCEGYEQNVCFVGGKGELYDTVSR